MASVALLAVTTLGLCFYTGLLGDNFRVVSPNKCYRSGQMTPDALKRRIQERGIRCVVSLRGTSPTAQWLEAEELVCEESRCRHVALELRLGSLSPPEDIEALVTQLEEGPYPMLLHCRAGADRAGLASVLYLMVVEHKTLDEALAAQLTWRYGHVRIGKAASIDEFLDLYRTTAGGRDIKTWLKDVYPGVYAQHRAE
jgi:protein tyrosine/serine phosphatase